GIAQIIAIHLARNYAETVKELRSGSPSLPGYKLRQITDWMAENVAEDFDLAQLAAQVGLSKFHFHRLFKSAVGVSPSRYHINLRMDEAKRLLRETKKSVLSVARDVGYTNPAISRNSSAGNPAFPRATTGGSVACGFAPEFR